LTLAALSKQEEGKEEGGKSNIDFFRICEDCNFSNEHLKEQIEPINENHYIDKFFGKYHRIDFDFRVIKL
jgi:hypothetical protein